MGFCPRKFTPHEAREHTLENDFVVSCVQQWRLPGKPLPRTGDQGLGWNEVHLGGWVASHDTTTRALLSHRFSCATQKRTLHQWGDSGVIRFLVLRTKRIINIIGQQFGQWFFQVRPGCVEPPGQARVKRGAKVATWAVVVFASLFQFLLVCN